MQNKNVNQVYQDVSVNTSTPTKLIVMLYDGALRFLNQSKEIAQKRENKNGISWQEEVHINLVKVQNIIFELLSSLNYKQGGEISENLRKIYLYIIDRIIDADISKKPEDIDIILNLIAPLKIAWEELDKKYRAESNKIYPQVNNIKKYKSTQYHPRVIGARDK